MDTFALILLILLTLLLIALALIGFRLYKNMLSKQESDQSLRLLTELKKDNEHLQQSLAEARANVSKIEERNLHLENKIQELNQKINVLSTENIRFKQIEEQRKEEYQKNIFELNSIKKGLEDERTKLREERERAIQEHYENLKKSWVNHEITVEKAIREICKKHTIEYVDKEKVPFKGKPDNTIKICDEFIIFDAKSPASDNLENFPTYLKSQAESVKKYIKEEKVRKDIYLVIPSNTVEKIEQFSFNMADYNVYVVTLDALEPIISNLKKLEDYEFVNQLAPEERENICRVIGKFAHTAKRRIQIDQFFARQFFEVLTKCESDLPKDILEKAIEYEKSEKLNPPQEKRAKQILNKDLITDYQKIKKEAEAKAIALPTSIKEEIETLPLNEEDEEKMNSS